MHFIHYKQGYEMTYKIDNRQIDSIFIVYNFSIKLYIYALYTISKVTK